MRILNFLQAKFMYYSYLHLINQHACICLFEGQGKKTKKKGQTLSLGAFLGDDAKAQVVTTSSKSWADEMEQADSMYLWCCC